jgi:hypothetical protein
MVLPRHHLLSAIPANGGITVEADIFCMSIRVLFALHFGKPASSKGYFMLASDQKNDR